MRAPSSWGVSTPCGREPSMGKAMGGCGGVVDAAETTT